jgi:dipeptidyl aminopeptidase/acylaminoacyl peptidase
MRIAGVSTLVLMALAATPAAAPLLSLEQAVSVRTLGQFAVSNDGRRLAYGLAGHYFGFPVVPRFGDDNNLRVLDLETGESRWATSGPIPKTAPVFSPSGELLAYESEDDIFVVRLADGVVTRATLNGAKESEATWSPDGREIAFVSNRGGRTDLWAASVESERHGLRRLTDDVLTESQPHWSPDGSTIAYTAKGATDFYSSAVYTVSAASPVASPSAAAPSAAAAPLAASPAAAGKATGTVTEKGAPRRITPADEFDHSTPRWSPDGRMLALLSDRSGYFHVWLTTPDGTVTRHFDLGEHDASSPHFDVRPVWSVDGKRLLVSFNREGSYDLAVLDVASGKTDVVRTGAGQYHEIGWRGDGSIVYAYENAWSPPDIFVGAARADAKAGADRRLTSSSHVAFREDHMARVSRVRFPSTGGIAVPAFLFEPRERVPGQRLPAIVALHPNGYGQFYDHWNPFFHVLANHGYVVLMVDQRGSSGYGRAYRTAQIGQWGQGTFDDVKAAAAFIKAQPQVDAGRVGVMGLSFGGYQTLLSLVQTPDLFRAGVDLMGPTDRRGRKGDKYRELQIGAKEEEQPELYARVSPITAMANLRAPLLILHSDRDRNVAPDDTYRLVDELTRLGKQFEVVIYPDEAHGLADPAHQLDSYRRMMAFFDRWLAPGGEPARK